MFLGVEFLGYRVGVCLAVKILPINCLNGYVYLPSHLQCTRRVLAAPHPCQHLVSFCLFHVSRSGECVVDLIYIFLMSNDVEHLFTCLWTIRQPLF